jgi:anthranilate phosphoribosyltransferase
LKRADPRDLKGGDPETNARAIRDLFNGKTGAYRDIVLLNAGGAFVVAGKVDDLKAGIAMAASVIDSGKAKAALAGLVATSNSKPVVAA